MHPFEQVEVRDGVSVGPCLAWVEHEVLKRALQGRGQQL